MPYDIETDNNIVELLPDQKLLCNHIYINDVDLTELQADVEVLHKKIDIINSKIDLLMTILTNDDAIVCTKDESGNVSCRINLPNTHEEDEPLGI